jgi:hypothetical protein
MILIAAGAVGLAMTRPALLFMVQDLSRVKVPALDSWQGWKGFLFGKNQLALNFTRFSNILLLNFLVWFLLAFLAIRLRRPRPTLGELAYQPGFAACASAVLAFALSLALLPLPLPPAVGQVVIIAGAPTAWLALLVTRRGRPEPGWIDRLGRVVGALFIVSSTAHMIFMGLSS